MNEPKLIKIRAEIIGGNQVVITRERPATSEEGGLSPGEIPEYLEMHENVTVTFYGGSAPSVEINRTLVEM